MTAIATDTAAPAKVTAQRRRKKTGLTPQQLLEIVLGVLDDGQAQEVVTIDLSGKASFCDYMVVASGRAQRHVAAMAANLEEKLKTVARKPSVEGLPHADWVLVDGGDVVVHLFRPEVRAFYNIEKMWADDPAAAAAKIEAVSAAAGPVDATPQDATPQPGKPGAED